MPHQWVKFCGQTRWPSRLACVKYGFRFLTLLTGVCLLVLLQTVQLPVDVVVAESNLKNLEGKSTVKVQPQYNSWMKQSGGPVPTICTGPDSKCLEALLLSPNGQNGKVEKYEIPAIVHLLSTEPSNQDPSSLGAFLLDWHRLHRNWTYVLWTKDEMYKLVQVFYRRYLPLAKKRPTVLPHLAPFLIVQKYGGVIVSSNHRPTRSVDTLRLLPAVFSADVQWWPEFSADTGLFMAAPGHPFMQYCSDLALRYSGGFTQVNLTHLLHEYAAAFRVAERARHSIHVAQLEAPKDSGLEITEARKDGAETSGRPSKLRILLTECERQPAEASDQGGFIRSWPLVIGCSTLRELFSILSNRGDTFVKAAAGAVPMPSLDQASSDRQLKHEYLASTFPMLNVGIQKAWKAY